MVPIYEEYEARQWAFFNLSEWAGLDVEEKAIIVAQKRLARYIELHAQDAVTEAGKNAEKK